MSADRRPSSRSPRASVCGSVSCAASASRFFASAANRAAFVEAPRRYAPAWGAFCAYGITSEDWWTPMTLGPNTDPDVWRIVDGRLFLFMYCQPERMFMSHANLSALIALGDARWYEWFGHRGVDVYNVQCLWDAATHGGGARDANATTSRAACG